MTAITYARASDKNSDIGRYLHREGVKVGHCPCCGQAADFPKVTVSLDFNSLSYHDQTLILTPTLAEMASVFVECWPRPVTRDFMFQRVWGNASQQETKSVDVLMVKLRRSFKKLGIKIETIWGVGWRMVMEDGNGSQ